MVCDAPYLRKLAFLGPMAVILVISRSWIFGHFLDAKAQARLPILQNVSLDARDSQLPAPQTTSWPYDVGVGFHVH
jgi:hypothetical protein